MYGSKGLVFFLMLSLGSKALAQVPPSQNATDAIQKCKNASYDGTVDALQIDLPVLGIAYSVTGHVLSGPGFAKFLTAPITAAGAYTIRKTARAIGPDTTQAKVLRGAVGGAFKYSHKFIVAKTMTGATVRYPVLFLVEGAVNNVCYELAGPALAHYCASNATEDQARCAGIIMAIEGGESLVEGAVMGIGTATAALAAATAAGKTLGAAFVAKTIVGGALAGLAGGVGVGFAIYILITNPHAEKAAKLVTDGMTDAMYTAGGYVSSAAQTAGTYLSASATFANSYLSASLAAIRGFLPMSYSSPQFVQCRREVPGTTRSAVNLEDENGCLPDLVAVEAKSLKDDNDGGEL